MANFSDKAEEVVGKAEEVAADVKEGVDATVEKASEKASELTEKASEQASVVADKASATAQQLRLDDKRVLVVAAIAGITLTLLIRRGRANRHGSRGTLTKRAAKRAAKTGLGRALTS